MPLFLGKDGKQRAVEANAGIPRTPPALWFGLLDTLPSGAESMTLAALVAGGTGEPATTGAWYAGGRKTISFGSYSPTTLICTSNNGTNQWLNTSGVTKYVGGLFICTVFSGGSGELLWVGYPDIGRFPVYDNRGVGWGDGLVDLKVV